MSVSVQIALLRARKLIGVVLHRFQPQLVSSLADRPRNLLQPFCLVKHVVNNLIQLRNAFMIGDPLFPPCFDRLRIRPVILRINANTGGIGIRCEAIHRRRIVYDILHCFGIIPRIVDIRNLSFFRDGRLFRKGLLFGKGLSFGE